jgi:mycothiol S-conjugate amidase
MLRLCLLTVHAHPDDEASKGAGTVARYHAEGVHTVLVTCTGGEEGDILNPAMDKPEVRENLAEVRRQELDRAAEIIGYDEVVMLGYRDSGMPDSTANADPRSFAQAPLDEAVGRLVAVIRRTQPQVVVTYPRNQAGYPHPDHLRVNEISEIAFDAAGDPDRYPEAGPIWQPLRLYYVRWSVNRIRALHAKFLELGMESPFKDRMARLLDDEAETTTATATATENGPKGTDAATEHPQVVVEIRGYGAVMRDSLIAHATQVDPTSPHWFGLPRDIADELYPYDEYELVRDLSGAGQHEVVDDLFAGLRPVPVV